MVIDIRRDNAMEKFSRSSLIYTKEGIEIIQKKKIAIMGLGGVGSYVFEALIRTGVREFYLYDADTIDITNCNRQLFALHSTLMKPKVDVAKMRGEDINPNVIIHTQRIFIDQTSIQSLPFQEFDYIIDAIDTVSSKILLIEYAKKYNVPIICSMGAGNKIDPFAFQITDISKTSVCLLAR